MKLIKDFFTQLKPVIQLEAKMQTEEVQTPVTLEGKEISEQVANESRADKTARKRFEQFDHLQILAVVEKTGASVAEVSIYERTGKRITVEVPDTDYLPRGCQVLAARYSNAHLDIVHI